MSPPSIATGAPAIARRIEMPDGPPTPVTRTRGSDGTDRRLLGGAGGAARVRGRLMDVALAHDLQRLDVACLREAAPVAGGRAQEVLLEVAAHLHLRAVGVDDLELALQVLVDRHEPRRVE